MILKPVTAYPSNGVAIDANLDNVFSTTIEGSSAQVIAYSYEAYDANTFKEQDPGLGKQNLTKTLTAGDTLSFTVDNHHPALTGQTLIQNGNSYYWILKLYQATADMFVSSGTIINVDSNNTFRTANNPNVKEGMYVNLSDGFSNKGLWKIDAIFRYTSSDGEYYGQMSVQIETPTFTFDKTFNGEKFKVMTDYIESQPFYFLARETPTLSINDPGTISTMTQTFTATYNQADGDGIKWYKFTLTDGWETEFDTTGEIYSSSLTYEADGLIEGQRYELICEVCTVNNMTVTARYTFIPQYSAPLVDRNINVEQLTDKDALRLTWDGDYFSVAKDRADYEVEGGALNIKEGNISYNRVNDMGFQILEDSTVLTDVTINQDTKEIISLERWEPSHSPILSLRRDWRDMENVVPVFVGNNARRDMTPFYMTDIAYGNGVYVCVGNLGQSYISKNMKDWYFIGGISVTGKTGEVAFGNNIFGAIGSDSKFYCLKIPNNGNIENLQWALQQVPDNGFVSSLTCNEDGFVMSVDDTKNIMITYDDATINSGTWYTLDNIGGENFYVNSRLIISKGADIYEYTGSPIYDNGLLTKIGTYPSEEGILKMVYDGQRYIFIGEGGSYATTDFSNWTQLQLSSSSGWNVNNLCGLESKNGTTVAMFKTSGYVLSEALWNKFSTDDNMLLYKSIDPLFFYYSETFQLRYSNEVIYSTDSLNGGKDIFPRIGLVTSVYGDGMTMFAYEGGYYYLWEDNKLTRTYGIPLSSTPYCLAYGEGYFVTGTSSGVFVSYMGGKFEKVSDATLRDIMYNNNLFIGRGRWSLDLYVSEDIFTWTKKGALPDDFSNAGDWCISDNNIVAYLKADLTSGYSKDFGTTWVALENISLGDAEHNYAYLQSSDNIFVACISGAISANASSYTYYLDVSGSSIGAWQQADTIPGFVSEFYYWRKGIVFASVLLYIL